VCVCVRAHARVCVHAHVHVRIHTGICWLLSMYRAYFVLKGNYTDAESIC